MLVVTTLLTSTPDPQRGTKWECDPALVETLRVSLGDTTLEILHDEPPINASGFGVWTPVERTHANPYFDRWKAYADHLAGATGEAWLVDGTDVEMLHEPEIEPGCLYVGSEPHPVGIPWMRQLHPSMERWLSNHYDQQMLNAGIVGGQAPIVAQFAADMAAMANDTDATDMGVFNKIARSDRWMHRIRTGLPVHTKYKAFEHDHPTAWWRHK